MTRHAKASSAGSTWGQGAGLGSFVLCLSIAAVLALCASPALAAQTHPFTGTSFGPDGVGGTESFERVQSLAVDPANGDTYVYDGGAGKVYKFDSAGAPVDFSATGTNAISGVGGGGGGAEEEIALTPAGSPAGTAGDIYVANNGGAIHVYSPAGAELGELPQGGETCGVATDPSGNFYAGVYSSTINKFTPSANPPTPGDQSGTGTVEHGICNVAADGLGNVYAANYSGNGLYKLEGIDDTTPTLVDPAANTMAVAPGSNDLYADNGKEVFQYDSSGTPIGSFANGDISESHGVAVNTGASKIYVGTPTKVKVFGPATIVPDAITEAAEATKTAATLHGTVGAAGGPDATCVFQYTSATAFNEHGFEGASEAPCNPAGPFSGSGTTPVSATATGLSTETEYRFRLLATSSNGSNGGAVHSFSTPGAVNVQTDPATNVTDFAATLNGTINPEGIELEECAFEYRTGSGSFESSPCAESPATIGSGNTPVSVHLDLTELVGGAEYQFRLVGKNELGTNQGAEDSFKTKGPSVGSESVSGVSETTTTFHATVNPHGLDTSYVFEYVTQADFESNGFAGATSVPTGGEDIGAGSGEVEVSATAEGLEPRTSYRFRVVAISADGTTRGRARAFATTGAAPVFGSCPNDRFRTGPSAKLPDCRAYEQVTPDDKFGADAFGGPSTVEASTAGDGITSYTFSSFPGSESLQYANVFLSHFAGGGWSTAGLNTPASYGDEGEVSAWTPDLHLSFAKAYAYEEGGGGYKMVMRDSADGSRTILVPQAAGSLNFILGGAFDNDSKVVFETDGAVPVTSGPAPVSTERNVYLYDRDSGELTLAGLLPDSACASPPCVPAGGSELPAAFDHYVQDGHVASPTGVYFIDRASRQLYLRRDAAGPGAMTERVSSSHKTNGGGPGGVAGNSPQPVTFWGATPDGSKAFLTSSEELTNNANTGPEPVSPGPSPGSDLYVYDASNGELTDVVPDNADPNGAEVVGVLGYSNDGSHVYFAANGDLDGAGPAARGNCVGYYAGTCSVYLWQENGSGTCVSTGGCISFVALVDAKGSATGDGYNWKGEGEQIMKTSRVSADGRILIFRSQLKLTNYDNTSTNKSCGEVSGGPVPCPEFYRYDAASGQVTCVTCNPTGAPPVGIPSLKNPDLFHAPTSSGTFNAQPFISRNLSSDGDRFFFQSIDKLVPGDVNGEVKCDEKEEVRIGSGPSCRDVYEWEAPGTPGGSCTTDSGAYSPANGGCIYLLSTGTGIYPSYLADVSESGDTAFIFSRQKLVSSDEDSQEDIYAVKVDGGLASQNTPRPAPCEGDACRGSSSQPSGAPGAGSGVFEGPGNPKQGTNRTRCPKGKRTVHSKGKVRCVAKKHGKAHKHKRRAHKSKTSKRAANNDRRASR